jgi:eukaryotic-like serine/threonine-protein kinase
MGEVRGADESGRVLGGKYELKRVLGEGGWGAVYEAVQTDLGRRVAVKVLHTNLALTDEGVARFQREAKAAAALGHPNIVQVTDFQNNPGEPPFIVMEYLDGRTLTAALEPGARLPQQRVAFIAQQILSALGAAHAAGIVHRDVKPDNIFLVEMSGVEDIVKVLDFGVAKLKGEGAELTGGGALLGSPAYMAPEQIRGGSVDARADLWSLAVCMYRALTGRMPFEASSLHALMMTITDSVPAPVSSTRSDVDPALVAVVERAMHKDPAGRYASAEEMARAIEPYARPTTAQAGRGGTVAMPAMQPLQRPSASPSLALSPTPSTHGGGALPVAVSGPPPGYVSHAPPVAYTAPPTGHQASHGPGAPTPAPASYTTPAEPQRRGASGALIAALVGVILLLTLGLGGAATAYYITRSDGAESTPKPAAAAPAAPTVTATATATAAAGATGPIAAASADDGSGTSAAGATTATAKLTPAPGTPTAPKAPTTPTAPTKPATPAATRKQYAGATARYSGGEFPQPFTIPGCRAALESVMPLINRCYAATEFEPPDHQFVYWTVDINPAGTATATGTLGTAPRNAKLDVCVGGALRAARWPTTDTGGRIKVSLSARTRDNP